MPAHLEHQKSAILAKMVEVSFEKMDLNGDGHISMEEFQKWSKTNTIRGLVDDFSQGWN